jgi:hypothetical protein
VPLPCYREFPSLLSEIEKTDKAPENAALSDRNGTWTAFISGFSL